MGTVIVQIKLMPSSPGADLENIKEAAQTKISEEGAAVGKVEEQPIAFGLSAVILSFAWPEEKELEDLEEKLRKIPEIQSVEITDMRRSL